LLLCSLAILRLEHQSTLPCTPGEHEAQVPELASRLGQRGLQLSKYFERK